MRFWRIYCSLSRSNNDILNSFAKALIIFFKFPVFWNIFLKVSSEAKSISTDGNSFSISILASSSVQRFLLKFTSKDTNAPPFLKFLISSWVSLFEFSHKPKVIPLVWKISVLLYIESSISSALKDWKDEFCLSYVTFGFLGDEPYS